MTASLPALRLVAVTAVWGVTFVQVKDAVAIYPLLPFLALRFGIASVTLAIPGAAPDRGRSGAAGLAAATFAGALLGGRLRAPDTRSRAHERLERRASSPGCTSC